MSAVGTPVPIGRRSALVLGAASVAGAEVSGDEDAGAADSRVLSSSEAELEQALSTATRPKLAMMREYVMSSSVQHSSRTIPSGG
mgnify:CR=1 FL=1